MKLAKLGLEDECIACDVRGLAGGGRLDKEAGTRRTFDVGAKRRARFRRALGEYEVRESTCMTCNLREAESVESDESRRAMIFEKVEGGECVTSTRDIGPGWKNNRVSLGIPSRWKYADG